MPYSAPAAMPASARYGLTSPPGTRFSNRSAAGECPMTRSAHVRLSVPQRIVVGAGERLVIAERDLVLAEVALPLRALRAQPRAGHLLADAAQQRFHPRGARQRVVHVVLVGRRQLAVPAGPGVLVGVAVDDEL